MPAVHETAIWTRVLPTSWSNLPMAKAEQILRLGFDKQDLKRMEKLGTLAQTGELSASDRGKLEEYLRVSHVLMLMKSKARQIVHGRGRPPSPVATATGWRRRAS